MTSITRKLQIRLIRRKLGIYLFSDFLLFLLASVAFFFGLEYNRFSSLSFLQDTSRTLTTDRGVNQIWYIVRDKSGAVLLEKDVTLFLIGAGITVASILLLQLISLLLGYFGENRQIRRILSPINAIALRADELSQFFQRAAVVDGALRHGAGLLLRGGFAA